MPDLDTVFASSARADKTAAITAATTAASRSFDVFMVFLRGAQYNASPTTTIAGGCNERRHPLRTAGADRLHHLQPAAGAQRHDLRHVRPARRIVPRG